jgi:thymidine kinase
MSRLKGAKSGKLTLIFGPMFSSKSLMMYAYFAPLAYTNEKHGLFTSEKNPRDKWSRSEVLIEYTKIRSLAGIIEQPYAVIGIDEIHMFEPEEADVIKKILLQGTHVFASGLDMDYRGMMYEIVIRLLGLGPTAVDYRKAACYVCKKRNAAFTQIFRHGVPVLEGLPPIVVDDGTYGYRSACLRHFIRKQ